ncbi:type IV secretory system conjugative DNA transfer family protein [Catenuloplanes japonicus]|uniref:type IV secretory system conjugative DNA transfer family protein n=1 Tax=Catenuloplanes japonicus TaxID=33876 RepID=UPI00068BEC86|nr:type IV secretory system conjugative DNA transfer family protein [Catenuloplanes japonicus]
MGGNTTRMSGAGWTSGTDRALGAAAAAVGTLVAGTWLSGQVAGLIFGGAWPGVTIGDAVDIAFAIPGTWQDPRQAWPAPTRNLLPGPAGLYTTAVVVFAVLGALAVIGWRVFAGGQQRRGMASRAQLDKTMSRTAVLGRASRLRPGLAGTPRWPDVAVELGRADGGMPLYASLETSVLLLAAPRQGKTSQVIIPWLRTFPGCALVTSVRHDVLEATATLRAGRSWVMELTGELTWPHRLTWSPVAGCDSYDLARKRADVMIQVGKTSDGSDSSNSGFFGLTATNLMAAWLHTAALTGRTMADVLAWSLDDTNDQPLKLLRDAAGTRSGVLEMLDSFYRQPDVTRKNLWTTVQTGTSSLLGDVAHAVFCGPVHTSFDVEAFLASGTDTIYLLVDEDQAESLAPLVTAFVDHLIATARRIALRSPNGRLDPPLGLILDELTNVVPLPRMPKLASTAAGFGIFVAGVLQNAAAAEERWGQVGRRMLWANSTIKIALGGLAGEDLTAFSELAGTYRETLLIPQYNRQGHSVQASVNDRKAMSSEAIRTLDEARREALVIHATTPPVKVRMVRHYESPYRKEYAQASRNARRLMGLTDGETR